MSVSSLQKLLSIPTPSSADTENKDKLEDKKQEASAFPETPKEKPGL